MNIEKITRTEATKRLGTRLPSGMNWYLISGLQWYPTYAHYSQMWACADGLSAIIGKRKQGSACVAVLEGGVRSGGGEVRITLGEYMAQTGCDITSSLAYWLLMWNDHQAEIYQRIYDENGNHVTDRPFMFTFQDENGKDYPKGYTYSYFFEVIPSEIS